MKPTSGVIEGRGRRLVPIEAAGRRTMIQTTTYRLGLFSRGDRRGPDRGRTSPGRRGIRDGLVVMLILIGGGNGIWIGSLGTVIGIGIGIGMAIEIEIGIGIGIENGLEETEMRGRGGGEEERIELVPVILCLLVLVLLVAVVVSLGLGIGRAERAEIMGAMAVVVGVLGRGWRALRAVVSLLVLGGGSTLICRGLVSEVAARTRSPFVV